jgi:hypothetical protein
MQFISNLGDNMAHGALQIPGASPLAYNALLVATEPEAPGMLKMVSICYNLLNETSRQDIANFMKKNFNSYYGKYVILTELMKNESTDPMMFLKENEALVGRFLTLIKVDPRNLSTEFLKNQVNSHVQDIINVATTYAPAIQEMLGQIKGGKRKSKRRRKLKRSIKYGSEKLRPVRGHKNFYLSLDKPCFENMHGTDIWNKEKRCGWYLHGKKISDDPDYRSHEPGDYVWRRE